MIQDVGMTEHSLLQRILQSIFLEHLQLSHKARGICVSNLQDNVMWLLLSNKQLIIIRQVSCEGIFAPSRNHHHCCQDFLLLKTSTFLIEWPTVTLKSAQTNTSTFHTFFHGLYMKHKYIVRVIEEREHFKAYRVFIRKRK